MKMKTITFISLLLLINFFNAQENKYTTKGISIETSATSMFKPDIFNIVIAISEFESTDPMTQETTKIDIDKIEETIYKKLKELNFQKIDLNKIYVNPLIQNYNYNYAGSQKKLLKKEISFLWNNEIEFETLFKKLQLKGVDNIYIESKFSGKLQNSIKKELLDKVIYKAKNEANHIAKTLNIELAEIVNFNENCSLTKRTTINNQYYPNGNVYYSSNTIGKQEFFTTVCLTYNTK